MNIKVDNEVCTKCGICIKYCSFDAIEYEEGIPIFNNGCIFCGACVKPCPVDAIRIDRKVVEKDLFGYRGVLAYIETEAGEVRPVGLEMLCTARRLADKFGEYCGAVLLGVKAENVQELMEEYGADKIYVVDNEELASYNTEIFTNIMVGILSKYKPNIVLFGATHLGRDLAPRIAGRIGTGLTADCTGLDINEKKLLMQIRPTFGGSIMATILTPHHRPQMATVRQNVMKKEKYKYDGRKHVEVETIHAAVNLSKQRVRLLEEIKEISPFSNVEEADYILSGGKGLGKPENYKLLKELINTLSKIVGESRVALGASRSAVDSDWIPHQHQVGQTGKTVTPKLYIACGISGQIQHIMGMRDSEKIIAINKDRNAPIFRVADLGIVGDMIEVVPHLNQYLRKNMYKLKAGNIDFDQVEKYISGKNEVKRK